MLLQFKQEEEFFMDPQRCIGCHACEMACAECETNGQTPMVSVDYVDRYYTPQTSVQICMHCEDPTCAKVCPADAIQKDEFGIVHSANTAAASHARTASTHVRLASQKRPSRCSS
jgi:Fe-S-cluster-containing dehydrogenase component